MSSKTVSLCEPSGGYPTGCMSHQAHEEHAWSLAFSNRRNFGGYGQQLPHLLLHCSLVAQYQGIAETPAGSIPLLQAACLGLGERATIWIAFEIPKPYCRHLSCWSVIMCTARLAHPTLFDASKMSVSGDAPVELHSR